MPTAPVTVEHSARDWRAVTAVCVCGWHGPIRRQYGDAHRDKIRHRRRCPYRHPVKR